MKIKTDELKDMALDWSVCEALGHYQPPYDEFTPVWLSQKQYSTNWLLGGPIIEREGISIYPDESEDLPDVKWSADSQDTFRWGGPTPLVAAMRCYVASKLGDEIEIPNELIQPQT